MIYLPRHFDAAKHSELIQQTVTSNNFAAMITTTEAGPMVSHLPFLYEDGVLTAHLARANPHAKLIKAGCSVLILFQGPHAYITPRWYEPAPDNVPTWNYAAVHVSGEANEIAEPERAYSVMQRLVASHDPEWSLTLSEKVRKGLLAGICVFQIDIERIEAKFKMSQNRTKQEIEAIIAGLLQGNAGDRETARLMLSLLEADLNA